MPKKKQQIDNLDAHPEDNGELAPGPGKESFKLAQFWKAQVNAYDEATRRWSKRANVVIKRYRDERNRVDEEGQRRMNLLWSNIKVMKPAIYSKCPIPIVDRKFLDRDPKGRLSSQMLERSLKNELDQNGFHAAMNMAVMDRLLPGRGVIWMRYEPKFGQGASIPAPTTNGLEDQLYKIGEDTNDKRLLEDTQKEEDLETTQEQVISEKTAVDYVDWRDFYFFPVKARTWAEVQAIGKKVYISKQEAIERFGKKIGKSLKPDTTPFGSGTSERLTYSDTAIFQDINERNIVIYEIWNKSDERVFWHSTGYDYLCDVKDDPLELTGFFPVPPPLFATTTNDTLIPVPDYIEWQDQAIQIDELTQRIAMLTKACKVAGVYNSAAQGIGRLFNESIENELIPVDQWAMFSESGGLKGAIDFIPIEQVQSCIETLQKVRQQAMIDLDQVTGLSDVIRGTSDSRETLGGLRLKNNNAGTRLSESQEEVARFARDAIRILSEIICKHFDNETLIESSGILYEDALQPEMIERELQAEASRAMPQAQQPQGLQQPGQLQLPAPGASQTQPGLVQPGSNVVPFPGGQQASMPAPMMPQIDPKIIIMQKVLAAIELLRKDVTRQYRIDIETDSTIFGDKYQERQDATEFITAVGGFMKQFEAISQNAPEAMPLLGKMLQWGVRKYRTGRDLESEVDNFVVEVTKKAKQLLENPPPSPDMMKAQAEIEQSKMEGQLQLQNDQRAAQMQADNDQRQFQLDQHKDQREKEKMQLEAQMEQARMAMEKEKMIMEMQIKREEHAIRMRELQANLHAQSQEHQMDLKSQKQEHSLDKQKFEHKKKEDTHKHKLKMQEKLKKKAS